MFIGAFTWAIPPPPPPHLQIIANFTAIILFFHSSWSLGLWCYSQESVNDQEDW